MNKKSLLQVIFLLTIILIATAQGLRPTFKGDPAACAWYNDTSYANPVADYSGWNDPRAVPWRGMGVYDQINVFARSNDDSLWWYRLTPSNSESFGTLSLVLPGTLKIASSPKVVQRGPNTIDVFVLTPTSRDIADRSRVVHHLMWNGRSWVDEVVWPAGRRDEIAVSSWGPDRLDLFDYAEDSENLGHKFFDGRGWSQTEYIRGPPGGPNSAPAAGSWGPNHIDLVVRGEGNSYYRKSYDIGGWGEWQSIGKPSYYGFASAPSITPTPPFPGGGGERKINIFGKAGSSGSLGTICAKGIRSDGTATSWGIYSELLASAPAAINYIGDHFTVFGKGPDNTLGCLDWDVGIWEFRDIGFWEHYRWEPVPDLPVVAPVVPVEPGPIVTQEQGSIIQMMNDTNIPRADYRDFDLKIDDPKLCGQACLDDSACVAWTYVKPGYQAVNARCWLKNNVSGQVHDECCVSGIKEIRALMP